MDISVSQDWVIVLGLVVVWDLVWKGIALWKASNRSQVVWFVSLLVINSAGIVPIIYLLINWDIDDYLERKNGTRTLNNSVAKKAPE